MALPPWHLVAFGRAGSARAAALCGALALAACAPCAPYAEMVDEPAVRAPRQPPARAAIPLPSQALLQPQREPDCEADPSEAQRLASASPSPPDPNADLALRIKLDYERECYRKAEQRVRERLQKLQAAAGDTIKAIKQSEPGSR